MFYMHKETGSIDSRDGWIASYSADELDARNLTAEQAFNADEGETLFQITPEYCTQNGGDCRTCSLVNYGRDCHNEPLHAGFNA
jgi:hypothetical protein